jgi:hypothetical protein
MSMEEYNYAISPDVGAAVASLGSNPLPSSPTTSIRRASSSSSDEKVNTLTAQLFQYYHISAASLHPTKLTLKVSNLSISVI